MKKKYGIKLFFAAEILIFSWFYYAGANGLCAVQELSKENCEVEMSITQVKKEIEDADKAITCWSSDDFYKEKMAREELHMAREDEKIYLI